MASQDELNWAQKYNGYERIARDPRSLGLLLGPAMAEYEQTRRIPEWCGVDFLRAWAFYRHREHHMDGIGPIAADFDAVLEAIRLHPAARKRDLPPARLPDDATE